MATFTLRQGNTTATLHEVRYQAVDGFEENNTWHVAEESISADSDTRLTNGPATLRHGGKDYMVTLTVLEFETSASDDEEDEPACAVELAYAGGIANLAAALGLLH